MCRPSWLKNGCGIKEMTRFLLVLNKLWQGIRHMSGEDAYERYLDHWRDHHGGDDGAPLDRKAFLKQRQERKWNGIKRCC